MEINLIGISGFLLTASVYDMKTRRIPLKMLVIFSAIGILLFGIIKDGNKIDFLAGMLPGVILLGISYMTRESIGYADGWSTLLIGLYLGFKAVCFILVWALVFAFIYAIGLLLFKKAIKNSVFAFIPFLCAAFFLYIFV